MNGWCLAKGNWFQTSQWSWWGEQEIWLCISVNIKWCNFIFHVIQRHSNWPIFSTKWNHRILYYSLDSIRIESTLGVSGINSYLPLIVVQLYHSYFGIFKTSSIVRLFRCDNGWHWATSCKNAVDDNLDCNLFSRYGFLLWCVVDDIYWKALWLCS